MKSTTFNTVLLAFTLLAFVALEIICARLAFHTIGEVTSGLYYLLIAINLIPLFLLFFKAKNSAAFSTAWIFVLGIAILVIPYQLYLGHKMLLLKEESANVMAYLYEEKLDQGEYPQDLSGYNFAFPELKNNFQYQVPSNENSTTIKLPQGPFHLSYHVGTPGTSHYYSFLAQKWEYYPD